MVETRNWHAWRDRSSDGQPCVRVHGECVLPGAGYGVELQRHGSEAGDAGATSGELVLDLVVRPPATDRGQPGRVAPADYVLEEATGRVTGVTIRQHGREVARLPVEAAPPAGVRAGATPPAGGGGPES
jgi:hypothetical protein